MILSGVSNGSLNPDTDLVPYGSTTSDPPGLIVIEVCRVDVVLSEHLLQNKFMKG